MRYALVCRIQFFQSSILTIPICVIVVFSLSFLAAYIYKSLWSRFDTCLAITDKVLSPEAYRFIFSSGDG